MGDQNGKSSKDSNINKANKNKRNTSYSSSSSSVSVKQVRNRKILINATDKEEVRVAFVEDGRLTDLDIESNIHVTKKSNIYKAVISRVEPSLNAVFVDYGSDKHGFLPFKEIDKAYFKVPMTKDNRDDIKSLLSEGQFLIIQVIKEERGNKGAAVSTFVRMPGCYLVLMPNNSRSGGISRQIEGEERKDLREKLAELELPDGMGVIVRTAGLGRTVEELNWDLSVLSNLWESIKTVADQKNEPFLIFQESDVIFRSVRDYLKHDLTEIIVDTQEAYDQVMKHVAQLRPEFSDRIKLYSDSQSLYSRYRLECQVELAYRREVDLLSGGSIVIDQGEALTGIDVNSKKSTSGSGIEETAFNTNIEAAEEITRQFKIRDLGGLIVIDFIDMSNVKNQKKLEQYLNDLLKKDRARTQCARISRFGLLEMSRQRVRPALSETLQHVCPQCQGNGRVRSLETFSLSMLRLLQEQLSKTQMIELQLILPVPVATYLLNEKRSNITELERLYSVRVLIIPHPEFQIPNYEYKRKRQQGGKSELSHQVQKSQQKGYSYDAKSIAQKESPLVTHDSIAKAPAVIVSSPKKTGILRRLWGDFFGANPQDCSHDISGSSPQSNQSTQSTQSSGRKYYSEKTPTRPGYSRSDNRHRNNRDDNRGYNRDDNKADNRGDNRSEGRLENRENSESRDDDRSRRSNYSNKGPYSSRKRGPRDDRNNINNKNSQLDKPLDKPLDKIIDKPLETQTPKDIKIKLPRPTISKDVKAILAKHAKSSDKNKLDLISTLPEKVTADLPVKIKQSVKKNKLEVPFDLKEVKSRLSKLNKVKLSFVETSVAVDKPVRIMNIKSKKI
jgi:ribonuclease E